MDVNTIYSYVTGLPTDTDFVILKVFENNSFDIAEYLLANGLKVKESTLNKIKIMFGVFKCQSELKSYNSQVLPHPQENDERITCLIEKIVPIHDSEEAFFPPCLKIEYGYGGDNPYTLIYTDAEGKETRYETHSFHNEIFLEACKNGHVEAAEYFFNHKKIDDKMKDDALIAAGKCGSATCVKYLLDMGVRLKDGNVKSENLISKFQTVNRRYPFTRKIDIGKVLAEVTEDNLDVPENIPTPADGIPTDGMPVIYDHVMYSNIKSRTRGQGDPIRGDLKIIPDNMKPGGNKHWFQVSANPERDLHPGAMKFLFGEELQSANENIDCENIFTNEDLILIFINKKDGGMVKYLFEKLKEENTCRYIYAVVENNDLELFQFLLEIDRTILTKISHDELLHTPVMNGNVEFVKYLIDVCVDILQNEKSFLLACANGHIDIVKLLIKPFSDEVCNKALDSAKNMEIIKFLIESRKLIPSELCLRKMSKGSAEDVIYLIEHGAKLSNNLEILLEFIKRDDLPTVQYLFSKLVETNTSAKWLLEAVMKGTLPANMAASSCIIL